ncbi:MAG TPA: glutamyl-tRNA reductase [Thermoanaerobaculia bacterium]|nr:glutamyl-tRNA reductase [Thermoanaerobaculia bacterium]
MSQQQEATPDTSSQRERRPSILLVGVDHRSAPVELRTRVSYKDEEAEDVLVRLLASSALDEVYLLSTCNRTEVYARPRDDLQAYRVVRELAFDSRAPELEKEGRLFVKRHDEAARHLLAVASGLESMVLGEPEILGQVKQAINLAESVGSLGPVMRNLLRLAATSGKRSRDETGICVGAVSLGYSVVELARNIFNRLENVSALLLGAGDISRQVAESLNEKGLGRMVVANRSLERAAQFRDRFPNTSVRPFEERGKALEEADVVVASTAANEPILDRAAVRKAMRSRPLKPLLIVDLGVPINIDPEVSRVSNVFLYNIDALDDLIQRNLKRRREEVPKVMEIIEQELVNFHGWYRSLAAEPLVAELQKHAEEIRRHEVEVGRKNFPPETFDALDRLTRSVVRKILHNPSMRLRGRNGETDIAELDLVRELFRLGEDQVDSSSKH